MVTIGITSGGDDGGKPASVLGRVGATLFFAVFLGMGLLFCFLIGRETLRNFETLSWIPTPCVIERSSVAIVEDGYRLDVAYRYEVSGVARHGQSYGTAPKTDAQYATLARLLDRYVPGEPSTCYVNPSRPDEAILAHASSWFGFMMLLPLVFVTIGAGGIFFTWRGASDPEKIATSRLRPASPQAGRGVGVVVLAACAILGSIFTWYFTVGTWREYFDARHWPEVPCVVESSRVQSHRGDDSTTYSVDILYRYAVGERAFRSNRYSFIGGSSSGYAGKRLIIDRHPIGKATVCFVNPDDPYVAILDRDFSWSMLLTLIPIVPLMIGIVGLRIMARNAGGHDMSLLDRGIEGIRSLSDGPTELPSYLPRPKGRVGPQGVTLLPETSRLAKLFWLLVCSLFWNGIVSIFVYQAYVQHEGGWFLKLFILPFVAVGVVLIGAFVMAILSMFSPRVVLQLSRATIGVGGSAEIHWETMGGIGAVRRLRIGLEGREEAKYRRGTTTVTDKHVFAEVEVADTRAAAQIDHGTATLTIPPGAMHSLAATNNSVIWILKVRGEIAFWPDIDEEYPIVVLPRLEGVRA